jgi:two-component system response regulator AtoC
MRTLKEVLSKVAGYTTTVLITGESGTGKELVARALHRASPRSQGPFVAVNCGAIPETLLESELFGHVKGAFTDAHQDKPGLFVEADGGTLLLDEVGELPLPLQVGLLRVLQEGEVRPVGSSRSRKVDVRVLAATHRDLADDVRTRRFREDLYYRLNVLPIHVPPLRDRTQDIPLLASHVLDRIAARMGLKRPALHPDTLKVLLAYPWPGNVRELENVLERSLVLASGDTLLPSDLPPTLAARRAPLQEALAADDLDIKAAHARIEREYIRRALEKTGGNRTRAADLLNISHRALLYKIKDYGLE